MGEPLSNLDAKLRLPMRMEIARLERRLGVAMIYVIHDQIVAMTLGQRIDVLDAGVIQQIDAPTCLYEKTVNLFVAGFFETDNELFSRRSLGGTRPASGSWDASLPLGDLSLTARGREGYAGREVALGLLAESLCIAPEGEGERAADHGFSERRDGVEPVANEVFLNLRFGNRDLVARLPHRSLPPPVSVDRKSFSPTKLQCFDARSRVRIGAD